MTQPLISCIIPVFNGERFLGEAIESILAQSYPKLEILVVDDGSTDQSRAVAEAFGQRVRCVSQENAGPSAAKNRGIVESTGEYVAFLDADDVWEPEKLKLQMGLFAQRPDLDIAVSLVQNFWDDEVRHEEARFRDHRISRPLPGFSAGTLLTPRTVFNRIGPFDPGLAHGEAVEWFARARAAGLTMEMIPRPLLRRRMHAGNRSRVMQGASRDEFVELVKALLDRRRSRGSGNE